MFCPLAHGDIHRKREAYGNQERNKTSAIGDAEISLGFGN